MRQASYVIDWETIDDAIDFFGGFDDDLEFPQTSNPFDLMMID